MRKPTNTRPSPEKTLDTPQSPQRSRQYVQPPNIKKQKAEAAKERRKIQKQQQHGLSTVRQLFPPFFRNSGLSK